MNKRIEKELKKCTIAKVSMNFDENGTLIIPQYKEIKLEEDVCFLIKLDEYVTNPPSTSTLATNWNNGSIPTHSYYIVDVVQMMGNMVKVNGIAYDYENNKDTNITWSGWLPKHCINVLKKL